MRAVRVNETKLTPRNAFIVNLLALQSENKSKYDQNTLFWDSPQKS